jgi:hypothetical protein
MCPASKRYLFLVIQISAGEEDGESADNMYV